MQILEVNGRPATSNRYTIMLGDEDINDIDTAGMGPGSIAFNDDGSKIYRLNENGEWVRVVNSGSGGGGGGTSSRAVYG